MNTQEKFLERIGAKVTFNYVGKEVPKFWEDEPKYKSLHNTYDVTISRDGKEHTFRFYDSIYNTKKGAKPTSYDVISCLTKYDVGSFEDTCLMCGFQYDSMEERERYYNIYKAIKEEQENMTDLFGDVLSELCDIFE